MGKGRLEAFSDGVLAIIITIMVLEMKTPDAAGLGALRPLVPVFLSYVLSFLYLGIYWSNHHHLLYVTHRVTGAIMWANLHLLFWLSLVPFATRWMGESQFAPGPTILYGVILLLAAVAYWLLQRAILLQEGAGSTLAAAVDRRSTVCGRRPAVVNPGSPNRTERHAGTCRGTELNPRVARDGKSSKAALAE